MFHLKMPGCYVALIFISCCVMNSSQTGGNLGDLANMLIDMKKIQEQTLSELKHIKVSMFEKIKSLNDKVESFEKDMNGCEGCTFNGLEYPDGSTVESSCGNQTCTRGKWIADDSSKSVCCEYKGVWYTNGTSIDQEYETCEDGIWIRRTCSNYSNINTCKYPFFNLNGQCIILIEKKGSWYAHHNECLKLGGSNLMEVTNETLPLLRHFMTRDQKTNHGLADIWIGGRKTSVEGPFKWPSGKNVSTSWGWQIGEPNDFVASDVCIAIWFNLMEFVDANCQITRPHHSICEMLP